MRKLQVLVDKVIGTKGNLHIPAYWMHKLLTEFINKIKKSIDAIHVPKNLSDLSNDVPYTTQYYVDNKFNNINNSLNSVNSVNSTLQQRIATVESKETSNTSKITNNTSAIQQINTTLAGKADILSIPTKVSQLFNDCAYLQDVKTGVYALTAEGELVGQDKADSTCKGVVLVTPNQQIMISQPLSYQDSYGVSQTFDWNFSVDGTPNIESIPDITQISDALLDFNGKQYTQALVEARTAYVESTGRILGTNAGYLMDKIINKDPNVNGLDYSYDEWYIPSFGQVYEVYLYHDAISAMYYKIFGVPHQASTRTILSMSEYSTNQYWAFDFYKTEKEAIKNKDDRSSIFCVRDINVQSVQDRVTKLENQVAALDVKIQELMNNSTR